MDSAEHSRSNATVGKAAKSRRWAPGRAARNSVVLYAAVGLGSMAGGVTRALVSIASLELLGPAFPWGTLAANLAGSFLIGLYAALTEPGGRIFAGSAQRQFVMAGFCGGFTTFSLFSLETFQLILEDRWPTAVFYVAASLLAWFAAVWLGHVWGWRINRLRGKDI
ncbi:fluoride efflux transporter FluC [Mesorhizobium xinjiangense]|uniref:fluoride efflux transporter FluC n=1 Tax=Mesorhizobium xinjiangense TaxID=2678685 RepID=UPI0012EE33EC|nr:CrcB family protein [Mesorhizobium xinjiangense]